ncbi:hypothetical protein Tco_0346277, partial [Tanacetum coccineum]
MFCFTSFGAKIDHSINKGRAPYTFRINGQNYHRMGTLLPQEGIQPKFSQLYFFDTQNEVAWVLAVGDGTVPAKKKEEEDEATWIDIPEQFLIKEW